MQITPLYLLLLIVLRYYRLNKYHIITLNRAPSCAGSDCTYLFFCLAQIQFLFYFDFFKPLINNALSDAIPTLKKYFQIIILKQNKMKLCIIGNIQNPFYALQTFPILIQV